jgi:hypothetical protein
MSSLNTLLNKLEVIDLVAKEVVIINVLVKYHNSYNRENQSVKSRELINLLYNCDRSISDKISDVKAYLQNKDNQNKRLFNYFVAEIESIWQDEFYPSYQLNNEFITLALLKSLHLLNEQGKQSIISEIVNDLDVQQNYIRNPASHSLIILFKQDIDIENKWQSLLAYARASVNANQVMYNRIVQAINTKLVGVNAVNDIALITQINNHEFYYELICGQNKSTIIDEVVRLYLASPSLMPSEASKSLCNKLQNNTDSVSTKWDHLINYFANNNNVNRNFHRIITMVLDVELQEQYIQIIKDLNSQNYLINSYMRQEHYQQASQSLEDYLLNYRTVKYPDTNVLVDKYSLLAECYCKLGNNMKAIKAYQNMLMLRNNELSAVNKVEILLKMFSCYLGIKDYKNAFIMGQAIKEIWQCTYTKDRKALENLIARQEQLRNQLIKEDGYLKYIKSYLAIDSSDYRSLFFRESSAKGTIIGAAPGAAIVYVGAHLDIFGLLLIPAGAAVAAAGAAPGALFGAVHGFFRASSRKPLNKSEQLHLIDNMNKFAAADDVQKERFIYKLTNKYRLTKTFAASDSSERLILALTNPDLTVYEKWHEIVTYILTENNESIFHPKESVIYKNNGKRLFCIINDLLSDQLNEKKENVPVAKV